MTTPRRRCSFSLRTLFFLVTILCAVGAWVRSNATRVAHRKSVTTIFESRGGFVAFHRQPTVPACIGVTKPPPVIPRLRRWLGDEPASYVMIRNEFDLPLAREAFPETDEIWIESDAFSATKAKLPQPSRSSNAFLNLVPFVPRILPQWLFWKPSDYS
jgi:hypothetical protein